MPQSMRKEMLLRLHDGHQGMTKCKAKARRLIFWPSLNEEIASMIKSCSACKRYAYALPSEPFLMRETPKLPWSRVGTDILEFAGKSYLVVFDAFSDYPEVEKLDDLTTTTVIEKLKASD